MSNCKRAIPGVSAHRLTRADVLAILAAPSIEEVRMAHTLAEAQDEVAVLVQQYRTNLNAYRAPGYKEAHARQDLIDPLWMALGWDVHNLAHAAPHRCEVIHEASLDIEGARKAPDYAFRFGAETVFYVEAKKPGIALKTAGDAAFQLRR